MTDSPRTVGELAEKLGIQITELGTARTGGTMPVAGNRQPYGLLHGGATAALAETLGSLHAAALAPAGHFPVGVDLNITHHRSMTSGTVTGVSTPAHTGRSVAVLEIVIADETGRRVSTARLSCMFRPKTGG